MTKAHLLAIMLVSALTAVPALPKAKRGDAAQGKIVFDRCAGCHSSDTAERKAGPSLKGLFKRGKLQSTGKPATVTNVLNVIREGGLAMPSYKSSLNDTQQADLLAYLKTL